MVKKVTYVIKKSIYSEYCNEEAGASTRRSRKIDSEIEMNGKELKHQRQQEDDNKRNSSPLTGTIFYVPRNGNNERRAIFLQQI